jgi:hypothetical protein
MSIAGIAYQGDGEEVAMASRMCRWHVIAVCVCRSWCAEVGVTRIFGTMRNTADDVLLRATVPAADDEDLIAGLHVAADVRPTSSHRGHFSS